MPITINDCTCGTKETPEVSILAERYSKEYRIYCPICKEDGQWCYSFSNAIGNWNWLMENNKQPLFGELSAVVDKER